jgi:sensor histidine kinase regulating citrate/malate metabolism
MIKKISGRFSFKISLILIIILFFSLLLNTFLNFFNFEKTYKDLVCSRFIVAARDLKNMIEYQLNLGLYLQELKNVQELINEIKARDASITEVEVFDENGRILFDTRADKIGTQVNKNVLSGAKKYVKAKGKSGSDEKPVTVMDSGNGVIILPVTNSYDVRVGSIALAYPEHIVTKPVGRILLYLAVIFAAAFLLFSIITFITVNIISKNLSSGFISMKDSVEGIIREGKSDYVPPGNNERMEEVFIGFQGVTQEALDEINRAHAEIDSMGKGEAHGN